LVVRGPSVTPGYWDDPKSTAMAIRDGWLHSGDLGTSDTEGRITFVDRMKDLIISGGINISPVELETAITGLEGVEEVAVIAARDPRFGETPAAMVTVAQGSEGLTEAAVIAHCEKILSDYKVPRYVVLRSEPLPRLPSGKLAIRAIRDEYHDVSERFARVR
jgi:fatty-acyl-CoA synthase